MDVADRIVVMNAGRIEQVGTPTEVYEHPATEFVMGFVGPVARLGDALVRPHDVTLHADVDTTMLEGMVERVVALGFEVRVELQLADENRIWVQLTREEAASLELAPGVIVGVRPTAVRRFEAAPA